MTRFIRVGRSSEFPEGEAIIFKVAENEEILIVNTGKKFFAFQRLCPHWNYPLESALEWYPLEYTPPPRHTILTCNVHSNEFDLETGESRGPATTNCLKVYPVKVEAGDVYVEVE